MIEMMKQFATVHDGFISYRIPANNGPKEINFTVTEKIGMAVANTDAIAAILTYDADIPKLLEDNIKKEMGL